MPKSEYEQFDDFELPDDKPVKEFSKNQTFNTAISGIAQYNVGQPVADQILRAEKMMNQSKFWRSLDKMGYTMGTLMIIGFTFLLGRYPHDHLYTFVTFILPALILIRFMYYCLKGWHWFLADFCYFVNYAMLFFLIKESKSQFWFLTCYVFANGPLGFAMVAFRNSLVYHEIDKLTSLSIHAIPMVIMTHVRWYTIPAQEHLPEEKQRFLTLP